MTQTRYTARLVLLACAILAGIALEHGQNERVAEAGDEMKVQRSLGG